MSGEREPLQDFQEGQWWVKELDELVDGPLLSAPHGLGATADQKRAVAVVHNMLRAAGEVAHLQQGEWISAVDVRRNVKALDVALNGPGVDPVAHRPQLVDIVSQVERVSHERGQPLMNLVRSEGNVEAGLRKERDGWRDEVTSMHRRLGQVIAELDLRRAHHDKDAWYWQGDGFDRLESMGNSMVVVIHAQNLRNLVAAAGAKAPPGWATLGVGDGAGRLFVHGDYESIKTCQAKLLELEELRRNTIMSQQAEELARAVPADSVMELGWIVEVFDAKLDSMGFYIGGIGEAGSVPRTSYGFLGARNFLTPEEAYDIAHRLIDCQNVGKTRIHVHGRVITASERKVGGA